MLIGYVTNGFGFHRLEDAIEIIADLGYRSVGITLDHYALDPFGPRFAEECPPYIISAMLRPENKP